MLPSPQFSSAVVIGGGPAGLMMAEQLLLAGVPVDLYDAMPSLGRKFLLAGIGGLNLTHSEPKAQFLARYSGMPAVRSAVDEFDADALRQWALALGIETFVGSSGRVFPTAMKAAPLLRAWLKRLRDSGLRVHTRHRCVEVIQAANYSQLVFDSPQGRLERQTPLLLIAAGGASWPQLGSDGRWQQWSLVQSLKVSPLESSNCGFEVAWSPHTKAFGLPLKGVTLRVADSKLCQKGECILTHWGLEGGLIYALSADIRAALQHGPVALRLDLLPDISETDLAKRLSMAASTKRSVSAQWARVGIRDAKADVLREVLNKAYWTDAAKTAYAAKNAVITVHRARPITEAISTAGGVSAENLNMNFQLKQFNGVFFSGEILDWDAPTGGYLLSACFAIGRKAGLAAAHYWHTRSSSK